MFYTYAHFRPDGRVFYIGKGSGNRYLSVGRSTYWKNVVAKEGSFKSEILAEWSTEAEAFEHEKFLIKCFRDLGFSLCNLTDGGEGTSGRALSDEVRDKLRQLGERNPNCGKSLSQETRDRISASTKKSLSDPTVKAKMVQASKQRIHSDETRAKIQASWNDPAQRIIRSAAMKMGWAKRSSTKTQTTIAEGALL